MIIKGLQPQQCSFEGAADFNTAAILFQKAADDIFIIMFFVSKEESEVAGFFVFSQ